MKLSIITINRNNATGLKQTMESVFTQTSQEFEYIVIDGASTDGSDELICQYANMPMNHDFHWISEKDSGIYNAMNKGIRMAKGEYLQFLNSGDTLATPDVTEKMLTAIESQGPRTKNQGGATIFYGNMLKQMPKGILRDKGFAGRQPTLLDFYTGTLNHSPAYIKRSLFEKYGLYDEELKIVSDWKWYLQVIIFGGEQIAYDNIDVTLFDMNGISIINGTLDKEERRQVLRSLLPQPILEDYEKHAFSLEQMLRIKRYWLANKLVWLMERALFKWEKFRPAK